ncbi:hypothetical protein IGI04_013263 [Brassica rapa subsp. trilocularis]|uniref:Uncharacterized protein n=1 Tax=Brassica rapa subsp. trilocularis TaxID=1813537 RepID=A0ABQ7NBL8_BRACM|nr:hypothetical protein IGI04_013263 [Brassica rapa subsp. trilocularis]
MYYSQISLLILLRYYDDPACVLRKIDLEHAEKLRQVKAVLEEGGNFSGIYRKVQLKPLKWNGEGKEERHVEALMIRKYGGVLTHAGRRAW